MENDDNEQLTEPNTLEEFDLGTLEKILLKTKNDEAIAEVNAELESIDSLSKRLDNHASKLLDLMEEDDSKPKRMNTKNTKKPSTVYVASQIANMISMKTHKLNLLKHKDSLRTSSLDRAMRVLTELNKTGGGDTRDLPMDQVLKLLLSKNVVIPTNSNTIEALVVEADYDEELDKIIEQNEIPSIMYNESSNEDMKKEIKEDNEYLVEHAIFLDTNEEKLFIVDEEYTIIREIDEDSLDVVELDNGSLFCNNHNLPIESDE